MSYENAKISSVKNPEVHVPPWGVSVDEEIK
jgi:hypothetical protein